MANLPQDEQGELDEKTARHIEFIDPDELIEFVPARSLEEMEGEETLSTDDEVTKLEDDLVVDAPQRINAELDEGRIMEKRENIRGRLALTYTIATFLFFALGLFAAVLDGILRDVSIVENLKEVIPLVSGIFLGTLGFVLGYYFKQGNE